MDRPLRESVGEQAGEYEGPAGEAAEDGLPTDGGSIGKARGCMRGMVPPAAGCGDRAGAVGGEGKGIGLGGGRWGRTGGDDWTDLFESTLARVIGQTSSSRRGLIAADSLLHQTSAGVMISRHARALLPSPLSAFPFCKKLLSNQISGPA